MKHIKDKMQNMQVPPPADAWQNIESKLDKKRPTLAPKWVKNSGIAASLLLAGLSIWWISNNEPINPNHASQPSTASSPADANQRPNSKNDLNNTPSFNENPNTATPPANPAMETPTYTIDKNSSSNPFNSTDLNQNYTNTSENHSSFNLTNNSRNHLASTDSNKQPLHNPFYQGNHVSPNSSDNSFNQNSSFPQNNESMNWQDAVAYMSFGQNNSSLVLPENEIDWELLAASELGKNSLLEDLKEEKKEEEENKKSRKKFTISPYAAPTLLASLGQQQLLSSDLAQFDTENPITMAYGAKLAYPINDKWKVRAGVGVTSLNQITKDVPLRVTNAATNYAHNIMLNTNMQIVVDPSQTFEPTNTNIESETGLRDNMSKNQDISLDFRYIEIPVEVEYKALSRKSFDLSISGGMSNLLLDQNQITLSSSGDRVVGQASNLQDFSITTNAGVKLDLKVLEGVNLNVEPQLRYMINGISNNGNAQPFIFNVNTGLSYSF